jgi:hypothetical protein
MKRIIFTFLVIILATGIYAQELSPDTSKKEFKNVIGLDITGLLTQIFINNSYDPYIYNTYYYPYYYNRLYTSPYILTYRRIYKKHAYRLGIGGNIANSSYTENDTIHGNMYRRSSVNIGLGYEKYGYLTKRWSCYYGIDAICSYSSAYTRYRYSSSSNEEQTSSAFRYGVSPLFGVLFRFNNRISIATETSYDFANSETNYESKNASSGSNSKSKNSAFETQFHTPSTIILRIQF